MIVNFWILPFALLLLWLPRQWLRLGGERTKRASRVSARSRQLEVGRDEKSNSLQLKYLFSKSRNWLDLARAATGAVAVNYACFSVELGAAKSIAPKLVALKCALLVIAVLVQAIRIESNVRLVAPIFFVLGLSFGLIGWQAALFAFVAVWTCNRAIPNADVFLFAAASFQLGFGMLLARGLFTYLFLSAALTIMPLLLSGIFKRPLVQLRKPSRGSIR